MAVECGEWSLVSKQPDGLKAIPLRCRKWGCSSCGPRQKRRLLKCLQTTSVDALLTLTCASRHYTSPAAAFIYLSRQIPHLMKRLRRAYPCASIEYFVVWEETRLGWPHAHVLLRSPFIPQRLLSAHWYQLARSRIVDIRAVHQAGHAARYLAKYLTKQPAVPPGYRRFRTSRAFWQGDRPTRPPRDPSAPRWHLQHDCLALIASQLASHGFSVTFDHPSSLLANIRPIPPPVAKQEYPYAQPGLWL